MSAIPWVGQDIVEFISIAIISLFSVILFSLKNNIYLPTIGIIHKNALKKSNKTIRLNKQEYISNPSSFLAFLLGLIDGDGYIQVTMTSKGFIAIKLVISLHLKIFLFYNIFILF